MSVSGRVAALVTTVAGIAYPFAVLYAVKHEAIASLWVLGVLAVILCVARVLRPSPPGATLAQKVAGKLRGIAAPLALLGLALVARRLHWPRVALAWPTIVNLFLLWKFATSLATMPVVERFARMQDPGLTPDKVAHCRATTKVWCGFFALNAVVSTLLAWWGDVRLWTFYTGVLSYVFIGLLFAGEVIVRKARFGVSGAGMADRIAARLITMWRSAFAR